MTNGTFTNTYLVGRKTVPFVTAPAEQNHSDRQRTGDQHMRKGTYSVYGAFRPLLFGPAIPPTFSKDSLQNELPARPLRLPSLETSHPPRQDAQINYLDILTIFVKQTTYLAILPLFGHLALIWPPCPIAPPRQRNSKKTKRNLFCTTPLRSRGLSSLTSLSSHFFYRQHNPGEFLNPDDLGGTTWGGTDHP
jgi:hypothetical protein